MAPFITHLVIGERAFAAWDDFEHSPTAYGAFLLGCVLVDVNTFSDLDRRQTHFVGRLDEDGEDAFRHSCARFLSQLDGLLNRPWERLDESGRAFVAGYLCHLAADEGWKALGWRLMQTLGLESLADLPVPGEVLLTVFDVRSRPEFADWSAVVGALESARVPDVLTTIPHAELQRMWASARDYLLDGGSVAAYLEMLRRAGKSEAELARVAWEHETCWHDAETFIDQVGGVRWIIDEAVDRSLAMLPALSLSEREE